MLGAHDIFEKYSAYSLGYLWLECNRVEAYMDGDMPGNFGQIAKEIYMYMGESICIQRKYSELLQFHDV